MKKNVWRGLCYLFAALILVGSTAGTALEANRNVVDGFLGTKSYTVVSEGGGQLYTTFTADYADTAALVAAHEAMGEQLMEEGAVLLKNTGALPLQESARKVTLLGIRADANTLYGATIGVNVPAAQNVSLTTALTERGFTVNGTANAAYGAIKDKGYNKMSPSFSGVLPDSEPVYAVLEPSAEDLSKAESGFMDSLKEYGDAAIVVLGRPGSEAADYYPGSTGIDPASGARNPLALTDAERALVDFAGEHFGTVIVLLNSANTMEVRELEENEKVSAILWIGWPGNYGMRGVADILTGEVNPSGALPDLYASDTASTPAMANFGVISWANASGQLDTAVDRADFYVIEAEGIYTGYRYYETRAVNNVLAAQGFASGGDAANAKAWNYAPDGGVDTETYAVSRGGVKVQNQLSDADYNTWAEGTVTCLSRADWEGTWPRTYDDLSFTDAMLPYLKNDFYQVSTGDDVSGISFGKTGSDEVTFSSMKGAAWDDERWETLLDKLDLQEAVMFITMGNRNAPAMASVGFSGGQYTENSPNGFNAKLSAYSDENSPWYVKEDDPNASYQCNDMGCAPLVAASFNKEFAEAYGVLWGNDSLFNGLPFIWGPGLNLHRHAYNGRNGEYYSEDPVLSGYTGLAIARGALTKGLICAPKHYAFNDLESNNPVAIRAMTLAICALCAYLGALVLVIIAGFKKRIRT